MDHKKIICLFTAFGLFFALNSKAQGFDPYYANPNPMQLNTGAGTLYNPMSSPCGGSGYGGGATSYGGGYMVGFGMNPMQNYGQPCYSQMPTYLPQQAYQPNFGLSLLGALGPGVGSMMQKSWDKSDNDWKISDRDYRFDSDRTRSRTSGKSSYSYNWSSSSPDRSVKVTQGPAGHPSTGNNDSTTAPVVTTTPVVPNPVATEEPVVPTPVVTSTPVPVVATTPAPVVTTTPSPTPVATVTPAPVIVDNSIGTEDTDTDNLPGPDAVVTPTPSSQDVVVVVDQVNDTLQDFLTPKHDACKFFKDKSFDLDPAVKGAMRVMATFYQDCDVLDRILDENYTIPDLKVSSSRNAKKNKVRELEPQNKEHYISNHPYLKIVKEKQEKKQGTDKQCRDVLKNPPLFSYGSKSNYKSNSRSIDLFKNQAQAGICKYSGVKCNSSSVTGIDCSGFIQASLWSQGLKFYKSGSKQGNGHEVNTGGLIAIANDKNSCLKVTDFEGDDNDEVSTLKSGDIVSLSKHHTFMIGSVGEDPLGVNRVLKHGKSVDACRELNRDVFDFTVFQSGSFRDVGVAHIHVRSANSNLRSNGAGRLSSSMLTQMEFRAQSICEKAMTKKLKKESFSDVKEGTGSKISSRGNSHKFSIIRHKGEDDPACNKEPMALKFETCVKDCLEKRFN